MLQAAFFIGTFQVPLEHSPSQIYISALPYCSDDSFISHWLKKVPCLPIMHPSRGTIPYQPLILKLQGHTKWVESVAFSPCGKYIASGSSDKTVRLWNLETGAPVGQPYQGHNGEVCSVTFSPNGIHIASGSHDKTVHICSWNDKIGISKERVLHYRTFVTAVAFSPDGNIFVAGCNRTTLDWWDVRTWTHLATVFYNEHLMSSLSFSSDGHYLAATSYDMAQIWNVQSQMEIGEPFPGRHVTFSRIGMDIAIVDQKDQCIVIIGQWNAARGLQWSHQCQGHESPITSLCFSPSGDYLAAGSNDETVCLWSVKTGQSVFQACVGHVGMVLSVAFSPNSKYVASCGIDKIIYLWCPEMGKDIAQGDSKSAPSVVTSISFSPDGRYIAVGIKNGPVTVYNYKRHSIVQEYHEHLHSIKDPIYPVLVSFSPDGTAVAFLAGKAIHLWSIETGAQTNIFTCGDTISSLSFSPNGKYIVFVTTSSMHFWNWGMNTLEFKAGIPVNFELFGSFSPKHNYYAVISEEQLEYTLCIGRMETGLPLIYQYKAHGGHVLTANFSWDEKYIVSIGDDCTVQVCSTETGRPVSNPYRGHNDVVITAVFSPSGKYIAFASLSGKIHLWNFETGMLVMQYSGHIEQILTLIFSPDEKQFISHSYDVVHIWRFDTGLLNIDTCIASILPIPISCIQLGQGPVHSQPRIFLHDFPFCFLALQDNGWLVDDEDKKILWIPHKLHSRLYLPGTVSIINIENEIKMDLTDFLFGTQWKGTIEHLLKSVPYILRDSCSLSVV